MEQVPLQEGSQRGAGFLEPAVQRQRWLTGTEQTGSMYPILKKYYASLAKTQPFQT